MHFRQAKKSELPDILHYLKEAAIWLKSKNIDYWQNWLDPEKMYIDWIQEGVDRGEFHFVENDDKILGLFRLQYSDELFWGKRKDRAGYIHSFTTVRAYAGMGLGAAVLRGVEDKLRAEGISILRLDCGDLEGLCRYYERYGFSKVGVQEVLGFTAVLFEKRIL